jgi:drug/metabolite transporter (DMT)-like permease
MKNRSLLHIAALALIWGSSFLWIKIALRGLSPAQVALARAALGAVTLLIVLAVLRTRINVGKKTWAHLFMAAIFANALPYLLFAYAEQHVSSGLTGVLNATTPLWTLAISLAVRHEKRTSVLQITGLILGVLGTLLLISPWNQKQTLDMTGAVLCLLATASYGISYVYMGKYLAGRVTSPLVLATCQLAATTGLLGAATPIIGEQQIHLRTDALVAITILGVFGTGVAYVLNYRIIADEGPLVASTVTYLLPIVSVILGAMVLNESITLSTIAGMLVIIAGVALARRRPESRRDRKLIHADEDTFDAFEAGSHPPPAHLETVTQPEQ